MKKLVTLLALILTCVGFSTYSVLDTFIVVKNQRSVDINSNISFSFDNPSIYLPSSSSSNPSSIPNDSSSSATSSTSNGSSSSEPSSSAPISSSSNPNQPNYYEDLTPSEIAALFTDEVIYDDNVYSDKDVYIRIHRLRDEADTTNYYVADIRLKSLQYFKTALAKNTFGQNIEQRTSDICKANNGILAINGDYYGAQEKGYVLRNGFVLRESVRSKAEDLAIYSNGTFEVFKEADKSLRSVADAGAWQVFSFGPGLIVNNEIKVTPDQEVDNKSMATNQRTAIGIISPLHYVFMVSDGRTTESHGFKLYEVAQIMKDLHCHTAYNLDGGGSSTMYFHNHLVNKPVQPTGWGAGTTIQQREISDIVFIGK